MGRLIHDGDEDAQEEREVDEEEEDEGGEDEECVAALHECLCDTTPALTPTFLPPSPQTRVRDGGGGAVGGPRRVREAGAAV